MRFAIDFSSPRQITSFTLNPARMTTPSPAPMVPRQTGNSSIRCGVPSCFVTTSRFSARRPGCLWRFVPWTIGSFHITGKSTRTHSARCDIDGAVWIGEYFGDVMLVNGKVWPFLNVEPRMYRFRVLNGCNARILNLDISGVDLWQIGAEGGMWDIPVPVKNLVMAPAERADVLVDFSPFAGQTIVIKNHNTHKPVSNPAPQ